jgi:exoribonuclease II
MQLVATPWSGATYNARMQAVFEEDGAYKAGQIMTDSGTALQVELPGGRRIKVKTSNVVLRFEAPPAAQLLEQAALLQTQIDLGFLWECAPEGEFGFEALGREFFSGNPSPAQLTALLHAMHGAPVYFQRKGRGNYKRASAEILKAALAGIERKQQQQREIDAWTAQMLGSDGVASLPKPVAQAAVSLVFAPDKMRPEYKALAAACEQSQQSARRLLLSLGAFADEKSLHEAGFMLEHFSTGRSFPKELDFKERKTGALANAFAEKLAGLGGLTNKKQSAVVASGTTNETAAEVIGPLLYAMLPLAKVRAFSVDDSSTTEIDDCVSVTALPASDAGTAWRIGVHIAAPGLAIKPRDPLDRVARTRMSTVYTPGDKITMLPEHVVHVFSLDAGREVPVLSLYCDTDANFEKIVATQSRVERLVVAANLRHDQLDELVSEQALLSATPPPLAHGSAVSPKAYEELCSVWPDLNVLWRFAQCLTGMRELVRGKPEPRNRSDFNFHVDNGQVKIVERMRDAPLDRIVAELMILANSQWGKLLADHKVPGIYRSQGMGRVKMTTHPQPHQGLGVAQYGWCTSPLRRYSDLVNQRQIIAVLRQDKPPYAGSDADLFAVISQFDAKYGAYADFQKMMERYWCLRWLQDQPARMLAVVVKEDLLRLREAPLYFRVSALPAGLVSGREVWVQWLSVDLLELTLEALFVELGQGAVELEEELAPEEAVLELAAPEPMAQAPAAPA